MGYPNSASQLGWSLTVRVVGTISQKSAAKGEVLVCLGRKRQSETGTD